MSHKIFDFGGSFIKIYCSKEKKIIRINNLNDEIIPLSFFKNIILDNINDDTEYIGISSQMHGFVLFDEFSNNLTEFISWKKMSKKTLFNDPIFSNFYLTGLKKRNDLPIINLNDIIETKNINNSILIFKNLTEAILDESYNKTHITMACGSGFYDIIDDAYIKEYLMYFKNKFNVNLKFDTVIKSCEVSGFVIKNNKKIPVYCGLGDFQATIYGCNLQSNKLLINMATGSQIATITDNCNFINETKNNDISIRPFFNDQYIKCITHIPSGRFLNIYDNFFKELNINIWNEINEYSYDDVINSTLNISTNIFDADGILISNIKFDFNKKNLICSILKHYIKQYIDIINKNNFSFNEIILSGGIAKKIKLIKIFFEKEFYPKLVSIIDIDDDSILGVNKFISK